jgi:hypothetical protein
MPFGPYKDFQDCVTRNGDKDNPEAYCAALEREILTEPAAADTMHSMRLQIVPVPDDETMPASNAMSHEISVEVEIECGEDEGPEAEDSAAMPIEGEAMPGDLEAGEDFHAMLVLEGIWTGDGRYIDEGALGWRDLPLPLMATDRTTEGHMNAVLVGNFTRVERAGREIHGYGKFVQTEDAGVMNLQNLIRNNELRGVSVDLDAVEYEVILPGNMMEPSDEPAIDENGDTVLSMDDTKMRITAARIMGATVVPFPAFQESYIECSASLTAALYVHQFATGYISALQTYGDIDFQPPQGARDEAERGLAWRSEFGRGGTEVGIARARDISNGRNLSPETIGRMNSYFARHEVDKQGGGWSPGEDGYPSNGRIAWALWGGDPGRAWARKISEQMASRDSRGSIVASGHPIQAPVVPPAQWFKNPELEGPTPITVTDEGRVYGHLAVWGTCHVGHANSCVEPPASAAAYAHFMTGEILCDDGSRVPVGQITMNGNHASHSANARAAAAHYDNTATAAVDVFAGEDAYGIWVAGALRPDLSPVEIRALMAADVSGDWRRIGGALELVAVLAVNVPGFPKIRVTEAAGLVASLSLPAYEAPAGPSLERAVERIAASIGRSKNSRLNDIKQRVHGKTVADLVARVKGN